MWSLKLITPPAVEPLTGEQLKQQSRVDFADEDDYLAGLAVAARVTAEETLSRSLITQTWELGLPCFPRSDRIFLPRGPVQSVTSVAYTDSGLTSHTMAADTDYLVDTSQELAEVVLPFGQVWPTAVLSTARPVVIRFVAGYGDAGTDIPALITLWMRQLAAGWYENREPYIVGRSAQAVVQLPTNIYTFRLRYSGPF
jgi:uncharacterized phiE125 gp8 family phage protein